jgi:hypothetical protein
VAWVAEAAAAGLLVGAIVTELARSPFNTAPPVTVATSASEELP